MALIININNGRSNNLAMGITLLCQLIMLFGGYVKVRDRLFFQVIKCINTILNHINTKQLLPRYEGSCVVFTPKWYRSTNTIKYPYANGIKTFDILVIDSQMASTKIDTRLTLVSTLYTTKNKSWCEYMLMIV